MTSIEAAVDELLDYYHIQSPDELADLEDMAWDRGVEVRRTELDGADGQLIRWGERAIINVRNTIRNDGQSRFVIAHEFGHFELHEGTSQLYVCTSEDMLNFYRESQLEREANLFAANLLMPRRFFQPVASGVEPSIRSVKRLARVFRTSLTSTAIRMVEMSDEACVVLVCEKERVVWYKSSASFPHAIDQRFKLSSFSFAHDALANKTTPDRPSFVESDTWLYFEPKGVSLFESSLLLGSTGRCLTLLWLKDSD